MKHEFRDSFLVLSHKYLCIFRVSNKVEAPKCNTSRSQTPRKEPKSKGKWTQRRHVRFQEVVTLPRSGQSLAWDPRLECVAFGCFHANFGLSLVSIIDVST